MQAKQTILSLSLGVDRARVERYLSHDATVAALETVAGQKIDALRSLNQKGAMRLVQSCSFIASTDVKDCDPATAVLVACIARAQQPRICFADARYLLGESVDGASHVAGVSRAQLHRVILALTGRVGTVGTIRSKLSRTFSKRGLLGALGVVGKVDGHTVEVSPTAGSNPFVRLYSHTLSNLTDGQLSLLSRDGQ